MTILPSIVIGQNIRGAIAGGINATQVDGDQIYGFHKIGLNAGAIAIIPFTKHFSASLETSYSQKGSYQSPQTADSLTGEYKLTLNYVDVPVLFQYSDKNIFKVGTGFSWGRLVNFKEYISSRWVIYTPNGPVNKNDVDVLIDIQLRLFQGFHFDFRYMYSVAKFRTVTFQSKITGYTWTRKQYNNDLAFRLIYIFKDSPSVRTKKNANKDK